jgi:membrane protein
LERIGKPEDGVSNFVEQQTERVSHFAQALETRVRSVPAAGALIEVARAYSEDRCSVLAAALSYYALLSLFPLALFILTVASQFISPDVATREVSRIIASYLPSGAQMVRSALDQVTRLRGELTLASAAGFIWSASGVFEVTQLGINRAFRVSTPRPMWRQRLVSIGLVMGVSLLFTMSFALTTVMRQMVQNGLVVRGGFLFEALPVVGGMFIGVAVFGLLYRYLPYDSAVRWRAVWPGALIAAVLWEIAKLGFSWYVTNLAVLNMVYGSVGAVIAVMLWGYLTAVIMLLGAEIASVASGARERAKTGNEWWATSSP